MSVRGSRGLDCLCTGRLGFTIIQKEVAFYLALLQATQPLDTPNLQDKCTSLFN